MHTLFDPIKCITPWRETWRLRVKVVRLWFHGNSVLEENDDGLLHLILIDQNLDKIEAIIKECFISDVVDVLDQGSVYIMTNFSIVPNIGSNRVTQHRFKLLFQEETTITPGVPFSTLNDGFSFCPISEILEKRGDSDYLIDFVGVITGVRPDKEINYCGKIIKDVILELYADGKKIQCNDGLFFVVAKVKEIFGGANWWLFSCVCGHSLDQVDNVFHCQVCDKDVDNAIAKYRVRIVVEDRNATAVFVLMDSAATKLFGKTCSSALMDHEKELNNGIQAPIYTPICEDYHHYAEVEKYKSRIACDAFIHACNVDDMLLDPFAVRYCCSTPEPVVISHASGSNVFILHDREVRHIIKKDCGDLLNEKSNFKETIYEHRVPPTMSDCLIGKKMVLMIDPRPVGYEYKTTVYIVHRICDDVSLVNLFERASSVHDRKPSSFQIELSDSVHGAKVVGPSTSRRLIADSFQPRNQKLYDKQYSMDFGCTTEATVNMQQKPCEFSVNQEVNSTTSEINLAHEFSSVTTTNQLQDAFKLCIQRQSESNVNRVFV
ncbi:uncharacterized protein LOC107636629 [Arachis ipaensis]|uniref:uncharacterized protein LOC107636629 n=1 Tax=Arachis ipaensis TaxID=130454 RepID=UPI0007AFC37A|nr:uncharacterized protein LOC107636629 [Arachis ipaensis]